MTFPPVLFVHGMWSDGAHWNRFVRHLERAGVEARAITLLYHESPQDKAKLRGVGLMDYVNQVRDVVGSMPLPPVAVGHSMGALVLQKVAESTPLRALALLGPVPPGGIPLLQPSSILCGLPNLFDALLRRPFVIPERSARYSLLNSLSEREQTVIYRSFVHESGGAFRDIISGGVRVDERRVSCPVLVAVGSRDRTTPPSIARRVARKYGAEYREYPGRCHYLGSAHEVIGDVTEWIMAQVSA